MSPRRKTRTGSPFSPFSTVAPIPPCEWQEQNGDSDQAVEAWKKKRKEKKRMLQARQENVQLFLITLEITEWFCCDIQRNEKLPAPVALQHLPPFFSWNHSPACQKRALYDCCCALRRVFNKISCCYLCLAGKPTHTYWSEQVLRRIGKKTLHRLSHSLHFSLFSLQAIMPATQQGLWE